MMLSLNFGTYEQLVGGGHLQLQEMRENKTSKNCKEKMFSFFSLAVGADY